MKVTYELTEREIEILKKIKERGYIRWGFDLIDGNEKYTEITNLGIDHVELYDLAYFNFVNNEDCFNGDSYTVNFKKCEEVGIKL